MAEPSGEKPAERPATNFQITSARLQTQIRKKPLCALRNSLPFVIGLGPRRRIGIEDSRRQALPVIIAPCITLIIFIPLAVGLPLFGIASFLARYIVEAVWTGLVVVLTVAGAASLSPQPTSPLLPRTLQYDLSVTLGLSFIIVVFLSFYNILLLCRLSFLLGQGAPNPIHASVASLLYTQESSDSPDEPPKPEKPSQQASAAEIAQVDRRLENGSIKTLSSGWDDEDDEKGKSAAKGESRFAKAKSLLTSPLRQSTSKT
ncbi:hypothetical protein PTTG_05381 [Puccinia triticina 1-1 BBBD Race 1]|uniref:Uncharacterized protein n=1 Tax=Puccinia triticina (isolate 1-1 / race 1 (BBBD)) TaxID=630390 RepID=A0A0C4EX34_PUCT1|nr:hypothetical protein PTTG_05381 [Puccinia triticina 1-1 BBBD Race 1]WAR63657.1 hypothetical protein PtB15_17B258 [Puccinia triticina]